MRLKEISALRTGLGLRGADLHAVRVHIASNDNPDNLSNKMFRHGKGDFPGADTERRDPKRRIGSVRHLAGRVTTPARAASRWTRAALFRKAHGLAAGAAAARSGRLAQEEGQHGRRSSYY
ncbi:unnamed protein product [Lampetra planeri]